MDRYRPKNGMRRRERGPDVAPAEPAQLSSRATGQVHEILREADQQAAAMRREVEDWARTRVREIEAEALGYLDEAKSRSDELVARQLDGVAALSAIIEEHAQHVISLLEETDWIKVELRDLVREMREVRDAETAAGTTRSAGRRLLSSYDEAECDDESIRLLALQMAMQGSTRSQVERRIGDEFYVRELTSILDEVFGAGTPGSHRIGWNANHSTS